jgi:Amt family ammonium transporter
MATPIFKAAFEPESEHGPVGRATMPGETIGLNLPENADSRQQRQILDALPVLVFLDRAGTIVFANSEARQMLGQTEGEWTERPVEDVLWGLYPGTAEPQTLLTGTAKGSPFHATMPSRNGQLIPVEGTYSVLDAERREAVIIAHPGGRERAPKSRLMEDLLASLPEAVAIEHDSHVLYTNPAFTRMFGYSADEVTGQSLRNLIVPETRLNELASLEKAVDEQGRATVETVRMNRSGELIDVSLQCAHLLVDDAKVGYVFTFRDIADRKHAENRLQHDAMHDALTGLPNRALFMDRLSQALSRRVRRPEQSCGVLFLDLDRFKQINDALGHAAGDVLLLGVAERLATVLRPQDSAARLSGDEFAVLVENILSAADLEIVAQRIVQEMNKPFDIFGHQVRASASIGAAMAGPAHLAADLLVRDADFAMYRAKQAGGGQYEIFDKHLEVCISSLRERERQLRSALEKREFEFRSQPVFSLQSGRLESLESLLCWRRPDGTAEEAPELMEVAESTGLSISLGREALEAACRQLRASADAHPGRACRVSVNLTARQFFHPDMIAQLRRALMASGADPALLQIEVPETALNENPDAAVAVLQRVSDCHVRVAIDDFGSGLAPLNHLVRLPIETVKLDPKLTLAAVASGRPKALIEALIRLCRNLGIMVVAQGIETPEQLQALIRMGCDRGQGKLLGPPLDAMQALLLVGPGPWAAAPRS